MSGEITEWLAALLLSVLCIMPTSARGADLHEGDYFISLPGAGFSVAYDRVCSEDDWFWLWPRDASRCWLCSNFTYIYYPNGELIAELNGAQDLVCDIPA